MTRRRRETRRHKTQLIGRPLLGWLAEVAQLLLLLPAQQTAWGQQTLRQPQRRHPGKLKRHQPTEGLVAMARQRQLLAEAPSLWVLLSGSAWQRWQSSVCALRRLPLRMDTKVWWGCWVWCWALCGAWLSCFCWPARSQGPCRAHSPSIHRAALARTSRLAAGPTLALLCTSPLLPSFPLSFLPSLTPSDGLSVCRADAARSALGVLVRSAHLLPPMLAEKLVLRMGQCRMTESARNLAGSVAASKAPGALADPAVRCGWLAGWLCVCCVGVCVVHLHRVFGRPASIHSKISCCRLLSPVHPAPPPVALLLARFLTQPLASQEQETRLLSSPSLNG
jgi:hypothetical protein